MTEIAEPAAVPDVGEDASLTDRMGPRELLTFVSAVMALMALGIDLMLPAFDDIRTAFDLGEGSPETAKVITVFFVGLAVATLAYGPLADRFGRRPVLYVGLSVYLLGAVGSALAPTFELLLVARFVWGIGAAGSRVVATSIIRDRFEGNAMASALSQAARMLSTSPPIASMAARWFAWIMASPRAATNDT